MRLRCSPSKEQEAGPEWSPSRPPPLQHGARLALVELAPRDEAVWRRRVEQRGSCDAGTADAHKPGSWAEIEAIRERNNGSEAWSAAADVSLRCELDSTGSTLERQVQQVLVTLAAAGVQPAGAAAAAAAAMGEAAGVSGRGNIVTDRQ